MALPKKKSVKNKTPVIRKNIPDRELKSNLEYKETRSDRASLFIIRTFGSMKFLCACILFFLLWIIWNLGLLPGLAPFDRYPFPALEMVVSIFAIILSVSVLISQNRHGRIEKIRQRVEFEVNVSAENEVTKVLIMLHEIQKKMGIDDQDSELENMKERIDLQKLHHIMDHTEKKID